MAQQLALVTGGNRGIGLEVIRQLAEQDYKVILGSRDKAKGEEAAQGLAGDVTVKQLDVADSESVNELRDWVADEYGQLDVLVNNAAINYDSSARALSVDLDEVRRTLETNLFGAWQMAQTFIPLLKKSEHGRLVNVSSESGSLEGMGGGTPAYGVSKVALNALTKKLAAELEGDGILVNAVCPGWTATDMGGGGRPVPEGAASVVWAVTLEDDGPTGGFFRDGERLPW